MNPSNLSSYRTNTTDRAWDGYDAWKTENPYDDEDDTETEEGEQDERI